MRQYNSGGLSYIFSQRSGGFIRRYGDTLVEKGRGSETFVDWIKGRDVKTEKVLYVIHIGKLRPKKANRIT